MIQLIKPISEHPVLGFKRGIRLKSIQFVDFDLQEARVIWEEVPLDVNDAVIEDPTVSTRDIISVLSNKNKVNAQGITITLDYIKSITDPLVDETEEEYNTRVQGIYETEIANGNPEFDFYINMILNLPAVEEAIILLDSLNRFDRK